METHVAIPALYSRVNHISRQHGHMLRAYVMSWCRDSCRDIDHLIMTSPYAQWPWCTSRRCVIVILFLYKTSSQSINRPEMLFFKVLKPRGPWCTVEESCIVLLSLYPYLSQSINRPKLKKCSGRVTFSHSNTISGQPLKLLFPDSVLRLKISWFFFFMAS
jgi:hypothetical protein